MIILRIKIRYTIKPPLVDSPNKGHILHVSGQHQMHRLNFSIQNKPPNKGHLYLQDNTECTNVSVINRFYCTSSWSRHLDNEEHLHVGQNLSWASFLYTKNKILTSLNKVHYIFSVTFPQDNVTIIWHLLCQSSKIFFII